LEVIITNYLTSYIKFRIGTELRSRSAFKNTPGPGQYNLSSRLGESPKYTMSTKAGALDMSKFVCSPGPGNYNPNFNSMFKSYSYSMRIRPNSSKSEFTPGPGNYNLRTERSLVVPSYKFGNEKKCELLNTTSKFVPGPGNYKTTEDLGKHAPKFSFGKEMRGDRGRPMTPGPGAYQHKYLTGTEGPKITMSARPQSSGLKNGVPGPGQYNLNLTMHPKSPEYKIGTSQRNGGFKYLEDMPGPAQYSPIDSRSTRPKSPAWGMGTGMRKPLNTSEAVPGPGNYNINSKVGEGPKYTLTGKNFYNGARLGVPGPGQYNSNSMSNLHKNPSWRIGTSTRDDALKRSVREGFPGPGNYSLRPDSGRAFRFGSSKRDGDKNSFVPGPGAYHIPCSMVDVAGYQTSGAGFNPVFRYI
jgi:hypothetical protein